MKTTICWTDIPVNQLDRAIDFYSAVLGAPVSKQSAGDMQFGLLPHAQDGVSGCLYTMEGHAPSLTGPLIYFSVAGRLDEAVGLVSTKGGKVIEPKHQIGPHGFRALVVDSEGNKIALHSPTA